jgi:hypothetical protein
MSGEPRLAGRVLSMEGLGSISLIHEICDLMRLVLPVILGYFFPQIAKRDLKRISNFSIQGSCI